MATAQQGDSFPELTHGGAPNIRACREARDTMELGNIDRSTQTSTVSYLVPFADLCFYYPDYGIGHPDCPSRFFLARAQASRLDLNRARLVETYTLEEGQSEDEPPPTQYSLRSSEFAEPIQLNEKFWAEKPGPMIFSGGKWVPNPSSPGVLADWARGFVADKREGVIPDGMEYWTDGKERNAFPAGHECFGVESYLESGAEWVVTEYDVVRPSESDISGAGSELHTISNPLGLSGASAGKWLYTGYNSDFDGQWWTRSRTWRFNKAGWKEVVYGA